MAVTMYYIILNAFHHTVQCSVYKQDFNTKDMFQQQNIFGNTFLQGTPMRTSHQIFSFSPHTWIPL